MALLALFAVPLNRRLGMNLPVSESYTTIAGFLMSTAGEILHKGETVSYNGHIFRVEEVDKRRILLIRMEKSVADDQPPA